LTFFLSFVVKTSNYENYNSDDDCSGLCASYRLL
jgi:hypothetical protein